MVQLNSYKLKVKHNKSLQNSIVRMEILKVTKQNNYFNRTTEMTTQRDFSSKEPG